MDPSAFRDFGEAVCPKPLTGTVTQHKERPRTLLAFWATWIGQFVTMELSGNHRRGCGATSMEGVCRGEVYHRVEVLLHVRDGRAREDGHGQGYRRKTRATLYGRGSTRWPPSNRRRTRPRTFCSDAATFGIGKRPGAISSRHGPGGYVSWAKSADLGGGHAKEGLDFCIQTVEESRERTRELDSRLVAMSELHRRSPHVLLCIFQLGLSLAVREGI